MSLSIRPLSPDLALKAEKECFEVPERIEKDVEALRTWLQKTSYLKGRLDDQSLVSILRSSKYSLERTKKKIDVGLTMRTLMPEIFGNLYPFGKDTLEILKAGIQVSLPLAGPDSPRVFLHRDGVCDPKKFDIIQITRVNGIIGDIVYRDCDNFAIAGYIGVFDQKLMTFEHAKQVSPVFIKKMAYAFQEGAPYRIKGMHFINFSPWIAKILVFFKYLLSQKIQNRIFIHESLEDLYKVVPQHIFPEEYGGDAGPVQNLIDNQVKYMLDNEEYFKEQQTLGSDEKKRPGKPKTVESVFGLEGSFRQLEFD